MTNNTFNRKQVEISFRKFTDNAKYVLTSNSKTFKTNLETFIFHCENDPVMRVITNQLKNIDCNFDELLSKSMIARGSLATSGEFILPLGENKTNAFLYNLCLKINSEDLSFLATYCSRCFGSRGFSDCVPHFNREIVQKLVDSLGYKFEEIYYNISQELGNEVQDIPEKYVTIYNNYNTIFEKDVSVKGDAIFGGNGTIEK